MNNGKAIIITGPVGSGKSTTMLSLAALLSDRDISCAGIDMDSLRWFHPNAPGDRFGAAVGLKHLRCLAQSYRELGIPSILLADVIEESTESHEEALEGFEIVVVRLAVDAERLAERIRARETEERVAWYLERSLELTEIMERNGIGDIVIEVTDESPQQVARMIARHFPEFAVAH